MCVPHQVVAKVAAKILKRNKELSSSREIYWEKLLIRLQGCVATLVLIFVWGGATGTHTQAAEGDKRFILHCLQSQTGDKTGKDSLVNFILMT